ncbi:MAG: VCBS repeat-containing protein [Myxococcales bacterium]|jgi:hypothetical protein|nr:VCBS repeat-containing protein [Myxococcales bacterium]
MRSIPSRFLLTLAGVSVIALACEQTDPAPPTPPEDLAPPDFSASVDQSKPAPVLSALSVKLGPTTGGTTTTLSGSGFLQGATVSIGGKAAMVTAVAADGTTITATTGARPGVPGDSAVSVTNPDGQVATLPKGFRYYLSTVSFPIPPALPTASGLPASGPRSLAVLDVNGDQNIDLVTANGAGGNSVSVLLGTGNGGLGSPTTIPLGMNGAQTLIAVDLNKDTVLDYAVTNLTSNSVSALLRSGGTTTPNTVTTGTLSQPNGIAAADLDGDGDMDLVVSNQATSTVSILLNSGAGTVYTTAVGSPFAMGAGFQPYHVATGDLDKDSRPDVVVGSAGTSNLRVILNKPTGYQLVATATAVGQTAPTGVVIGDFDGDGTADVATANRTASSVSILKGNGAGTLTVIGTPMVVGTAPEQLLATDMNLDGVTDLVVPNSGSASVHVLLGKGDGTFTPARATPFTTGPGPLACAVADFNSDGRPDLAVTRYTIGAIDIILSDGQ